MTEVWKIWSVQKLTACSIINFNNPTLDRIQMKEACSLLQTAYHSRLGMHHYNAVEYLINKVDWL